MSSLIPQHFLDAAENGPGRPAKQSNPTAEKRFR
jgi:hypothetical protein